MDRTMMRVGLTGGIGSGKTMVASLFAHKGITIIDADVLTRVLTEPNTNAYQKIVAHFGTTVLLDNKQLNRAKLRKLIFANHKERHWLEALLHPLVRSAMRKAIEHANPPYCIVVIPLLAEAEGIDFIDRVLVVDTPLAVQIERAKARDQATQAAIEAIIASQSQREQRLAIADDIITNDQDIQHLEQEVTRLHQQYIALAERK